MKNVNLFKIRLEFVLVGLIFSQILLYSILSFSFSPFVSGGVGENVTVQTFLDVGASFPEIINITIEDYADDVSLNANSTRTISCVGLIVDYNNESDFQSVEAEFYDTTVSNQGDGDDNNYHYTNSSCTIDYSFADWYGNVDDEYHVMGNCTFEVEYFANPGDWECSMLVTDNAALTDRQEDNITILELLAIGLPNSINYGTVNATYVSEEQIADVSNTGNVEVNLSLSGYAVSEGDGYAMNCSLGREGNILLDYEKYNLTSSTAGAVTLSAFENLYLNLSSTPEIKEFNLNYRQNDVTNDAISETYWRIYVPKGVAGSCQGNILFGAVQANGS